MVDWRGTTFGISVHWVGSLCWPLDSDSGDLPLHLNVELEISLSDLLALHAGSGQLSLIPVELESVSVQLMY